MEGQRKRVECPKSPKSEIPYEEKCADEEHKIEPLVVEFELNVAQHLRY